METIKCLTGFELKIIALITMTLDHIGAVLLPQYGFLRIIGRLAFPIYCFLLVEGFVNTKDVRKYLIRLLLFAFVSEIFFDMTFYGKIFYNNHQNVFFTLTIGLMTIIVADYFQRFYSGKTNKYVVIIMIFLIVIAGGMFAELLKTDYSIHGIFIIFGFYEFRKNNMLQLLYQWYINGFVLGGTQLYAVFALPFIFLYNGERGKYKLKYFFYLYYPFHLIVLYIISRFIL